MQYMSSKQLQFAPFNLECLKSHEEISDEDDNEGQKWKVSWFRMIKAPLCVER